MNQSELIKPPLSRSNESWRKPTMTGLDADLAYFNARVEFVKTPKTINQKVQLAIFRALIHSTTKIVNNLRQLPEGQ